MSVRDGGPASLAAWLTPVKARHHGVGSCLIDKDETLQIEIELAVKPRLSRGVHIATSLLGGVSRLFLSVIFLRWKNRQSEAMLALAPWSFSLSRNSASVMSDFVSTAFRIKGTCASMRRYLRSPSCCLGEKSPASRWRLRHRIALAALTPNRSAACRQDKPPSIAAITRWRRSRERDLAMHAGLLHQHAV